MGALLYPEIVKHPVTWDGVPEEGLRGDSVLHALLCPQSVHGKVPHLELLVLFLLLKTQLFNVNGTFPHFVLLYTQSINEIDSTSGTTFVLFSTVYGTVPHLEIFVLSMFTVHLWCIDFKCLKIVSSYVNFSFPDELFYFTHFHLDDVIILPER